MKGYGPDNPHPLAGMKYRAPPAQMVMTRGELLALKSACEAALTEAGTLKVTFRELTEADVLPEIRHAAEAALTVCCRDLSLPPPPITWFGDEAGFASLERASARRYGVRLAGGGSRTFRRNSRILGFVRDDGDNRMWLRSSPDTDELRRTVAHEVRHLFQFAHANLIGHATPAEMEQDADEYAAEMYPR